VKLINLRDFGIGKYRQVDDRIYGGGVGMVLRIEPIAKALQYAKLKVRGKKTRAVLLTPQGKTLDQKRVRRLSKEEHLILICGKYEGVDERVRELVDEEVSIGDYILSGGEIAALVIVDAITRLLPGVLDKEATKNESFKSAGIGAKCVALLEPPQYTRPEEFKGMPVPEILLSGNHQEIAKWRQQQAFKKTNKLRPDLLN
jgi:tRNA (guanine37-N1)-methyltransferase